MPNSNRDAGHNFERHICQRLRELGFTAETARYVNPKADDLGKDIITNAPFAIQCKRVDRLVKPHEILKRLAKNFIEIPLIIWKRRGVKNQYPPLIIMKLEDFETLIKKHE